MTGKSVGVVYGCRFSEKQAKLLWDEHEELGGLVGQYEDQDQHAHREWKLAADKSLSVIGYWTHLTVEDTEHLPCRLVEYGEMLKTYADSERGHEAIERWARFAERMRERGVKLDEPSFWVAEYEPARSKRSDAESVRITRNSMETSGIGRYLFLLTLSNSIAGWWLGAFVSHVSRQFPRAFTPLVMCTCFVLFAAHYGALKLATRAMVAR